MIRLKRFLAFCLLYLQLLFVSVAGAVVATHDDLHVATVHQLALEHHHHDDFSSHFDHDDGSNSHVHAVDSFLSVGLVAQNPSAFDLLGGQKQPVLLISRPSDIFLEGLLRPPQILL